MASRSALARSLGYAFGVDVVAKQVFTDLVKALANIRPATPLRPIGWPLDGALQFVKSDWFNFIGP